MTAEVLANGQSAPAAEANGRDEGIRDAKEAWAICCSGGGIRSASYCLGALQRLAKERFLGKTKLIVGVSGGGYIASSRALVAHGLGPGADPAYAPGTPEERHLRDNTRYLAPDAKTLLAGVLSLLLGAAVTLVLVLTPLFAAAHVWGWVLRATGTLTTPGAARSGPQHLTASVTGLAWWIPGVAAGVTLVIFVWCWVTLIPGSRDGDRHSQVAAKLLGWTAFITVILALAWLAVPELTAWLSGLAGTLKAVVDKLGFGTGAAWTPAALTGFVTAIVGISQSAQKLLANNTPRAPGSSAPGPKTTVAGYLRVRLLPWLASALIVLAGFAAALRWVKDGAAAGLTRGQVWVVLSALALMLAARVVTDLNRISLHDFYRWRLATAYAITRKRGPQGGEPTPFGTDDSPGTRLSQLANSNSQPKLVICATANINAEREVSAGRGGVSITFDSDHVTLRDLGNTVQALTSDYEALVGKRRLTLFDVSAISGAAFSPLMGAVTQQAHRILFTVTDLRLGVWLPHPAVVKAARQELTNQQDAEKPDQRSDHWWHALGLLIWYMLPHPPWPRREARRERKEARLWAYVLRLCQAETGWQGLFGGLLYHAMQPTLGMLWAEAAGHTSYRSTWMCVTDGGHYDNLGLVEALQRRTELKITHILVLDASGDKVNTWSTLGGSIALARSDAATEIVLDPSTMIGPLQPDAAPLDEGQVVRPWASGTFTVQGEQADARPSPIVVCKLGWWTGAPWDVRAYAAGHRNYPTESTMDQLYDSAEFDAYRELGWAAIDAAMAKGKLSTHTITHDP